MSCSLFAVSLADSRRQVYKSVGFEDSALLINSINNAMGIVGQILCVLFLDKVGRRIPLVGGNIVAGSMFIGATVVVSSINCSPVPTLTI